MKTFICKPDNCKDECEVMVKNDKIKPERCIKFKVQDTAKWIDKELIKDEEINILSMIRQDSDKFILMGSRQLEVATDKSDWDFALLTTDALNFFKEYDDKIGEINTTGYVESLLQNSLSYKFETKEGDLINFICYKSIGDLEKVKQVIHQMSLQEYEIIKNKSNRCTLFEAFIKIFFDLDPYEEVIHDDNLLPF